MRPVLAETRPVVDDGWRASWIAADRAVREIVATVAGSAFEEAAATRATAAALDVGTTWHVASSTPIRDVDWFVAETAATVRSNRGANGIDGTVATALGRAIGRRQRTVVTLGDVALVHDIGGLMAAGSHTQAPTVIVYDNGGGGIFSLLPIGDAAEPEAFDAVLHTPTRLDLPAIAAATGYGYERAIDPVTLTTALAEGAHGGGPRLIHVPLTVAGSREQLMSVRSAVAGRL